MKLATKRERTKREKWMLGILAVACAALLVNIVLRTTGVRAGGARPAVSSAPAASPQHFIATSAKTTATPQNQVYSSLQLDLLDELQSAPPPSLERNPFEFGLSPAQKAAKAEEQKIKSQPPAPPAPPPPPPVTVKALGFAEDKSGKRRAILADDEQTYKVVEGESFAGRYRCMKVTTSGIEIQDESYHQTVQLPFPQ
jgi:hypothetical protein